MTMETQLNSPRFPGKKLVALIVPLIIEQFLSRMVGMADTMMVSYAGEVAVSGVSLVDMVNQLTLTLLAALATGGAVVTSQYLGARLSEKARKSANQLVLMAFTVGLLLCVVSLLLAPAILRLFFGSITPEVMDASLRYFRILACSYPFMALYNAGAAIFRSLGNSRISMQVSMLMNLINVGGNAFCIFGLHMGIEGVAIPSFFSFVVAAVLMLWLTARIPGEVYLEWKSLFPVDREMCRDILHVGIPSATENSIFQLGRVLVVSIISTFGTVEIAANAVANNLDGIGCVVGQAMSLAMITVVGQCIGAGDFKDATHYTKKLLLWCYLIQNAVQIVILFNLKAIIGIYSVSPEIARLSWILVAIHMIGGIFMWPLSFVLPNALRAANDVRFTMWVSIGSMFVFRIALSVFFARVFHLGAIGVWIAMEVDWVCRICLFGWRFLSGKWLTYAKAKTEA